MAINFVCIMLDLAQHFLLKHNITAIRRLKKSDNNRVARYVLIGSLHNSYILYRACGAVICNRTDELQESDVGTGCGLFEVRKIGDEYFTYLIECKNPKACTIVLRGASKDILNEVGTSTDNAVLFSVHVCVGGPQFARCHASIAQCYA